MRHRLNMKSSWLSGCSIGTINSSCFHDESHRKPRQLLMNITRLGAFGWFMNCLAIIRGAGRTESQTRIRFPGVFSPERLSGSLVSLSRFKELLPELQKVTVLFLGSNSLLHSSSSSTFSSISWLLDFQTHWISLELNPQPLRLTDWLTRSSWWIYDEIMKLIQLFFNLLLKTLVKLFLNYKTNLFH